MVRSLLKDGRGYSLIEVMVSIILLALAIIPMVGMFDMGLNGVTASSKYDKARTLANLKLEQAKNLSFTAVEGNFPAGNPTPYDEPDTWLQGEDEDVEFTGLDYRVVKQYMVQPSITNPGASVNFVTSGAPTDLIRLRVEVRWGEDSDGDGLPDEGLKSFTTYGLVAR